ncbi:MAG: EamA family transporter [Flammeovirgaceae bacterium]|nr:EamA family transporter [Flammeovirgaceae bacterium]MBR09011.1 EamA family transporter [Rickettsiales bacterium]HCX23348.1 EamA family transporter [Cytophagales bacterium]|tara:strand:- start:1656 stop:2579 length:924 start_codon:yes stop_codon:yes gene_type:complete
MSKHNILIVLAFLAIYLIWGTTYLVIVIGLETLPPFTMAAIRFIMASILLLGYSFVKKESLPSLKALGKNALIGVTVLAGGQGLLIWSEQHIASGYASVLIATLPIWFVLLDKMNWSYYFRNPYILIGIALGFIGIGILFGEKLGESTYQTGGSIQIFASVLVIIGGICWVAGTLYNRSYPAKGSIYRNLGLQLFFGFVSCLFIALITQEPISGVFQNTSFKSWLAVTYLAIAGSIIAYMAYTWLLNQIPSAIVGTYAYINPIVAVFLGWFLANEEISKQQLVGMAIVLISAILINLNRTTKAKTQE